MLLFIVSVLQFERNLSTFKIEILYLGENPLARATSEDDFSLRVPTW